MLKNFFVLSFKKSKYFNDKISRLTSIKEEKINLNELDNDEELIDRMLKVKPAITKEDNYYDIDESDDLLEEYDETNPTHRIGKYILQLNRNKYKQIIEPSDWFKSKQNEVCNYRTTAQIRRHLKKWMTEYDRDLHSKYLHKPLILRHDDTQSKSSNNLIIYGPDETIAYTHYFMSSRYIILQKLLKDLMILLPSYKPYKVIDFGCGPGTAGTAIKEIYKENFIKYTGIDISRSMLDSARIFLENSKIDCIFYDNINNIIKNFDNKKGRYNLAILSYTLNELPTDASRRAAIQILYELLDINGCLIILESGNPRGSHIVRSSRQFALNNFNFNKSKRVNKNINKNSDIYVDPGISYILPPIDGYTHEDIGVSVIAPCTHDQTCPLVNGQYCSFAQSVISGIIRKESQEKYSYVILQKIKKENQTKEVTRMNDTIDPWVGSKAEISKPISEEEYINNPNIIFNNINKFMTARQILLKYMSCYDSNDVTKLSEKLSDEIDWDEYKPTLYRNEWSRVFRSPIKSKGHMTIDLCTSNGTIVRSVFSKSNTIEVPSLRTVLRKTSWGGLFPSNIINDNNESISPLCKKDRSNVLLRNNKVNIQTENKTVNKINEETKNKTEKLSTKQIDKKVGDKLEINDETNKLNSNKKISKINKTLEAFKKNRQNIKTNEEILNQEIVITNESSNEKIKKLTGIEKTKERLRKLRENNNNDNNNN